MKITRKRVIVLTGIVLLVIIAGLVWRWFGYPGLAIMLVEQDGSPTSNYQRLPEGVPKAVITIKAIDADTDKPIKEFFVLFHVYGHGEGMEPPSAEHGFETIAKGTNGIARFEAPVFKSRRTLFNVVRYYTGVNALARGYIPVAEYKKLPEFDNTVVNFDIKFRRLNTSAPDKELLEAVDSCSMAIFTCSENIFKVDDIEQSAPAAVTDNDEKVRRLEIARDYLQTCRVNLNILQEGGKKYYSDIGGDCGIVWRPGDKAPALTRDAGKYIEEYLNSELSEVNRLMVEIKESKTAR